MDNKATPEADKVKPKFNLDGDIDDENTIVSGIEVMFAHIQDANVKKNLMKKLRFSVKHGGVASRPQPLQAPVSSKKGNFITNLLGKVVKPMRNLASGSTRLAFEDIFNVKSFSENSTESVKDQIRNILNDETITPDMVLAYLAIGVSQRDYIIVESGETARLNENILDTKSNPRIICHTTLSPNSNTFILGSTLWINVDLLKRNVDTIKLGITNNFQICKKISTEKIFRVVQNTQHFNTTVLGGGNVGSLNKKSNNNDRELDIETISQSMKDMELQNDEALNVGMNYEDVAFLQNASELSLETTRKHLMKITYLDEASEKKDVVIKVAYRKHIDPDMQMWAVTNESLEDECNVYQIFKKDYTDFYDDHVIEFYGCGKVDAEDEVRFTDDTGDSIIIKLWPFYHDCTYLAMEYMPTSVTVNAYLKSIKQDLSNEEYSHMSEFVLVAVLQTVRNANHLSGFAHGDLHGENVLIDTESFGNIRLLDFEYSSIMPNIDDPKQLQPKNWINDIYNYYGNEYISKIISDDRETVEDFNPEYLWLIDSIRFTMNLKRLGLIDSITNTQQVYGDTELSYLIQSIIEMIPTDPDLDINKWLDLIWNGYQQSHEFVLQVSDKLVTKWASDNLVTEWAKDQIEEMQKMIK